MASMLTSDQVNYMIWRYFQESGFGDSARALERESKADRLDEHYKAQVRPGQLIYLIQRGLQYEELRTSLEKDGTVRQGAGPWVFLPPVPLEEDEGVGTDNGQMEEDDADDEDRSTLPSKSPAPSATGTTAVKKHGIEEVNGVAPKRRRKKGPVVAPPPPPASDGDVAMADADPVPEAVVEETPAPRVTNGISVGTQIDDTKSITPADSLLVGKEEKSIISCAWNPVQPNILATGGEQSIARIWTIPTDATDDSQATYKEMKHDEPTHQTNADTGITALCWSPGGRWLASGTYDGQTRIWSSNGILEHSFVVHYAPISILRWNITENLLLALSCDGKVLVWDVQTGQMKQGLDMPPSEQATGVEWITSTQYVAAGEHGGLHRYDVEEAKLLGSQPEAHRGTVECIEFDPVSSLLATGGLDGFVMTWKDLVNGTTLDAKLSGHIGPIVSLAWQPDSSSSSLPSPTPSGSGTPSPPARRLLASASEDRTVRLWDVVSKQCLRTLDLHIDPIEKMCFSPNGEYIASGANGYVIVWRFECGSVTHIYDRKKSRRKNGAVVSEEVGDVYYISWDASSSRVAVAEGEHKCAIFKVDPKNPSPAPTKAPLAITASTPQPQENEMPQ